MKNIVILDGAMGTMLQKCGLGAGESPELFGMAHEDEVEKIHRAYIKSGSEIITANTFGANGRKMTFEEAEKAIISAIGCARRAAAGTNVKVALDIGPTGELTEPLGTLTQKDAYEIFRHAAMCGEKAGADLIIIETMTDLCEMRMAIMAAKENTALEVFATMSFEARGRTFSGTPAAAAAIVMSAAGADAIGINCSLAPCEILPMAKEMASTVTTPLVFKPNAGLPDPETGAYSIDAKEYARQMLLLADCGAAYLGGCCGTDPQYIAEVKKVCSRIKVRREKRIPQSLLCSATKVVSMDRLRVVGERINPTGKKVFRQALIDSDMDYIAKCAIEQCEAGADMLDVNVGIGEIDEKEMLVRVLRAVGDVCDAPLVIDTTDPYALEAALRAYTGKALVNSVNASGESLKTVLPIVKKYGAAVVALTLDKTHIPETAAERFAMAEKIIAAAETEGIAPEDIYVDCLTMTASTATGGITLDALWEVKKKYAVKAILGVSNVSFGLPKRDVLNSTFLAMAAQCGLDAAIINPLSDEMMATVRSCNLISGADRDCAEYIEFTSRAKTYTDAQTLEDAVIRGLENAAAERTAELLAEHEEIDVIDNVLIPALDTVGVRFEKGETFLPQLLKSAQAAGAAFDVIKASLAGKGEAGLSKGTIVLATVEGDIHDIGKNIVKIILENYGYKIIDLGKDVPPQAVVEAVKRSAAPLVGLSALMTTTLPAMAKTIEALRQSGCVCKVMVGGAVLTPEYAQKINADFYSKDAKEAADIAGRVFS
ncbi:MAG: homocysteine S-methyltransferase family protein [Clostridia bacterium]|nr:homocysteine S-methyltransferase family protein [Clostridia bacterium]